MEVEQLFEQYEAIIFNVLKSCHIYRQHREYDDFLQEMRLCMFEELLRLKKTSLKIEHLGGYLKNLMKWKCFNLIRKNNRHQLLTIEQEQLNNIEDHIPMMESLNLLIKNHPFTPVETELIKLLYQGYSIQEIAAYYNKNERTIRRWRKAIMNKLDK